MPAGRSLLIPSASGPDVEFFCFQDGSSTTYSASYKGLRVLVTAAGILYFGAFASNAASEPDVSARLERLRRLLATRWNAGPSLISSDLTRFVTRGGAEFGFDARLDARRGPLAAQLEEAVTCINALDFLVDWDL